VFVAVVFVTEVQFVFVTEVQFVFVTEVQFVFVTEVQFASPSQRCNVYRIRIIECIDVTEVQCVLFSYVVVVGRSRHRGAVVVLVVLIPRKFSSFEEILGSSKVGVCLRGCRLRLRSSSITSTISVFFRLRLPSSSFFVFGYQLQIGLEFRILILERGLCFGRGATITGPPNPVPPTYPTEVPEKWGPVVFKHHSLANTGQSSLLVSIQCPCEESWV